MFHGQRGENVSFPDQTDELHEQGKGQCQLVADWVFDGKQVRHVPHQEQDAKSADGGFACGAGKFVGVDKSAGGEDECKGGLQIPGGDDADQQAGDPQAEGSFGH